MILQVLEPPTVDCEVGIADHTPLAQFLSRGKRRRGTHPANKTNLAVLYLRELASQRPDTKTTGVCLAAKPFGFYRAAG